MAREASLLIALAGLAAASWSLRTDDATLRLDATVTHTKPTVVLDRARQLEWPDGTSPGSPIVAVLRSSDGVDWYRHENGSYSATQMVWCSDLGRHLATTRVAHPDPTAVAAMARR